MDKNAEHKEQTQKQWNATPCGSTDVRDISDKESLAFFQSIRKSRYEQTDRWMLDKIPFHLGKGKKVLEIGFGLGTDLLKWEESGAECYGIDLTLEHHRLALRNFELHGKKGHLQIADAANIPFEANYFDLVYSNGVLHHTPDTVRCIAEAYRVLKPGGQLILSLYRTYSAFHLFYMLGIQGLLRGKLKKLGYRGLMATIEQGADGIGVKPLVKTYRKNQLKHMLADFSNVRFEVAHFKREHLSKLALFFPKSAEKIFEKWFGWYLIAFATK